VTVADAQVPDPSWEWAWRTWYVDMGRDVDEEGWEYSFYFRGFAWHGTHPWFHSFVRRRRWLRKRVRRRRASEGAVDAHRMNPEYFTIHSDRLRTVASSPVGGRSPSVQNKEWGIEEHATWEDVDISDIATLLRGLKEVPVDSERISLIARFLEQGGDDLNYLADEVRPSTWRSSLTFSDPDDNVIFLLRELRPKITGCYQLQAGCCVSPKQRRPGDCGSINLAWTPALRRKLSFHRKSTKGRRSSVSRMR
jgi:hypothetical protein